MRAKKAREDIISQSGLPYTIIHSTQFIEFIPDLAKAIGTGLTFRRINNLLSIHQQALTISNNIIKIDFHFIFLFWVSSTLLMAGNLSLIRISAAR